MGRYRHWRGSIDRHILRLLTFGLNPESLYKRPKKAIVPPCFHDFFGMFSNFSAVFPYIWPLAGPNISKRVGRYWEKLWMGSGWVWKAPNLGNAGFLAPEGTKNKHFISFES